MDNLCCVLTLRGKLRQHGPFLRKTKSELPVSGWSTVCGEREGGREGEEEEKGVRIPALAVQPTPGRFEGLHSPNMGFNFVTVFA